MLWRFSSKEKIDEHFFLMIRKQNKREWIWIMQENWTKNLKSKKRPDKKFQNRKKSEWKRRVKKKKEIKIKFKIEWKKEDKEEKWQERKKQKMW